MIVARRKSDQNYAAVDPWTAVHASAGLAAGLVNAPFWPAMIAAVGYEVFEHYAETQPWGQRLFKTSGAENYGNMLVDLLAFAVGHAAGAAWNRTG
jgi:hypothetical protein